MKRIAEEDLLHILKHTESVVGALKNTNIFITGATGFFGKWLLESFIFLNKKLSLNATICALSRNPEMFLKQYPFFKTESSVTFIKGDVQNFAFPDDAFQFIIHAATDADTKIMDNNPLLMLDTITIGTKRVLEFARKQSLKSILLISSGAVYGKPPVNAANIKETDIYPLNFTDPASTYAEGKRIAELKCAIYYQQYNMPIKIARCFAFVGPYLPLNKHFAIGNFISNGLRNENIIIKGDGSPYRSYMYAADLAIWLWTILLKGKNNIPYNVGSDTSISIKETAELVAKAFNNHITTIVLGKQQSLSTQTYVPNVDKAKNELNLLTRINILEAISRTVNFNN